MKTILPVLCLLLLASCGKNIHFETPSGLLDSYASAPKDGISELPYSYEIYDTSLHCTTGKHSYPSLKEVCQALLNDGLNKNCAKDKREELHQSQCASLE